MISFSNAFAPAFYASLAFFVVGTIVAAVALARWNARLNWLGYAAHAMGGVALTALLVQRWTATGIPPLSGLFDAVVVFAWMIVLIYLLTEAILHTYWLGLLAGIAQIGFLIFAGTNEPTSALMPNLKSAWLYIHVFAYMLSYAIMTVAFLAVVVYYVYLSKQGDDETTRRYDRLTYQLVAFGFPFLTAGVITGAIWANRAWGTYWSWDPKEAWSLITWIVYAVFLHLRLWSRTWKMPLQKRNARLNWIVILGFVFIIITFFLAHLLPTAKASQHIYTSLTTTRIG
jgi:cytochrome c-type biogenesis protein CcsB